jgi:hypothetical protein
MSFLYTHLHCLSLPSPLLALPSMVACTSGQLSFSQLVRRRWSSFKHTNNTLLARDEGMVQLSFSQLVRRRWSSFKHANNTLLARDEGAVQLSFSRLVRRRWSSFKHANNTLLAHDEITEYNSLGTRLPPKFSDGDAAPFNMLNC